MFTVGEFSRIAQVSKRLLRYYDEIGLLKPVHTDRFTGYRYYSAEQLVHLNRILALKEFGLSLEQIQRIVSENISTDELYGMFLLKKCEIERQIQGELHRLRTIEARLQAVRNAEAHTPLNVVIKHTPAQPVLSVRTTVASFETGLRLFTHIEAALSKKNSSGFRFCICHDDGFTDHDLDLEMGYLLTVPSHEPVSLPGDLQLCFRELPAAETMATCVVKGPLEAIHTGYTDIGLWTEMHDYRLVDSPREITLHVPQASDGNDLITEIQFPVEPVRHHANKHFWDSEERNDHDS